MCGKALQVYAKVLKHQTGHSMRPEVAGA